MKISKIRKALSGTEIRLIWDVNGNEWIGDGHAHYVLDDELELTVKNTLPVLDVESDKRNDYNVLELNWKDRGAFDICPCEDLDEDLTELMRVVIDKTEMIILRTDGGEKAMIPAYQVKPCEGEHALKLVLRQSINRETAELGPKLVAVFSDMLCCAIITPMSREAWDSAENKMMLAQEGEYCVEPEQIEVEEDA